MVIYFYQYRRRVGAYSRRIAGVQNTVNRSFGKKHNIAAAVVRIPIGT